MAGFEVACWAGGVRGAAPIQAKILTRIKKTKNT
jgi:hypothetical protein